MKKKKITFKEIKIEGRYYIVLSFLYDKDLHDELIGLGCKYNPQTQECQIVNTAENYYSLFSELKDKYDLDLYFLKQSYLERKINKKAIADEMEINDIAREWYCRFDRYLSAKRYSESTRNTYLNALRSFFAYFGDMDPIDIGNEELNDYIHSYIKPKNYSVSSQRQLISSLRLFYTYSKGEKMDIDKIESPRKERKLPRLLSVEEVRCIMDALMNLKHRTILMVLYGTGIRMAELLDLQVRDINSKQMQIHIIGGKGAKDRNVQLPKVLLYQLRIYYKAYRPKVYLFESPSGKRYSPASVNHFLKKAADRVGIRKSVSAHVIRHSYATHMMEKGVGLRYIQNLLGHNSSKTTEIYTHVSKHGIKDLSNPLDDYDTYLGEPFVKYNKTSDNPPF